MGRKTKGEENRIIRTISVQPTLWKTFKLWCKQHRKSMSDMIEMLLVKVMDEDRDLLSLTTEADDVRSRIQLSKYRMQRERTDCESLETELRLLEDRMAVVTIEEKQAVKSVIEKFRELKNEHRDEM